MRWSYRQEHPPGDIEYTERTYLRNDFERKPAGTLNNDIDCIIQYGCKVFWSTIVVVCIWPDREKRPPTLRLWCRLFGAQCRIPYVCF